MEDLIFSGHKESRVINGKKYLYEESIKADFGLVKAWKADPFGNLVFHKSAQNFNADVAKCSGTVIAEVEEMVAEGELDPDEIHLPGIYVDRIVVSKDFEKRIESVRVREEGHSMEEELMDLPPEKIIIAKRAAKEFQDGMCVNLGVGIPTLAANFIGPSVKVHIQSENGILGMGPFPSPENVDPDVINAGKQTVSILPSGSAFSSSESFSMIRGGHLQITMLGAFEVSQEGDLANWIIPNKRVQGMGGAMDLVSANNKVIVTTTHLRGDGMPKVLAKCSLPLTGKQVVDMIITDRAVFKVLPNRNGLLLLEFLSSKYSLEDIRATTGCSFKLSHFLKDMETGEPISVA
jgi:3-oxoacid CoA-transferase